MWFFTFYPVNELSVSSVVVKAKYFAGSLVAPFRKALAFQRYPSPEDTIIKHLIFELVEIKTFCRAKIFLEKLEIATFLLECK